MSGWNNERFEDGMAIGPSFKKEQVRSKSRMGFGVNCQRKTAARE
jgi:hypothetical protein